MNKVIKLTSEEKKFLTKLKDETWETLKFNENMFENIENILEEDTEVVKINDDIKEALDNLKNPKLKLQKCIADLEKKYNIKVELVKE